MRLWCLLLVALLAFPAWADRAEPFRMVVLDVGEGQLVLLLRGAGGVLIDTGHAGTAAGVLRKLPLYGVERLDYLFLSHLHPDHASGYFRIREAFPGAVVVDNGDPEALKAPQDMIRWVAEALEAEPERKVMRAGEEISWEGVRIRCLWPHSASAPGLNGDSLVLSVQYGGRGALIMGDVGQAVEKELLEAGALRGSVDVLVAGHHGSKSTADEAFLESVRPWLSVISVNAGNIRGYPDPGAVERLGRFSGRVLRTDEVGDVCVEWGGGQVPRLCSE